MVLSPKSAKERCASVATLVETRPLPADAVPARGGLYFCSGRRCVWACGGGSGACDELRGVVLVDLSGTSCQFAATGRTYCELASRTRTHGLDGARFVRIVSDAIKGASPRERAALVFFLRGSDFGLRSAPGVGPRSPSVASHVCGFLSKRADERGRTLGDDGDSEDGEDDDDTENDSDDDEAFGDDVELAKRRPGRGAGLRDVAALASTYVSGFAGKVPGPGRAVTFERSQNRRKPVAVNVRARAELESSTRLRCARMRPF